MPFYGCNHPEHSSFLSWTFSIKAVPMASTLSSLPGVEYTFNTHPKSFTYSRLQEYKPILLFRCLGTASSYLFCLIHSLKPVILQPLTFLRASLREYIRTRVRRGKLPPPTPLGSATVFQPDDLRSSCLARHKYNTKIHLVESILTGIKIPVERHRSGLNTHGFYAAGGF